MKFLTNAALAATLLAGTATVAAAPAIAADKNAAQGPNLKLSKEVLAPAQGAQKALAAKDTATAEPLVAAVEAAAKSEDDKYIAASLRLNLEALKNNNPGVIAPLTVLVEHPKTPQTDKARFSYELGRLAAASKDYAGAGTWFERARSLGYSSPDLPMQIVKLKMDAGDIAGGQAELAKVIDAQVAAGQKPAEELYRYPIAKTAQKKMTAETFAWIQRYLSAYPTTKNWRDMTVFYGIQPQSAITLDKGGKVDLYRLLRAGKALADQYDYEIYGQWAFDLGLPFETKTVLDEGKAAGKIPANSANAVSIAAAAAKSISNEGSLSSLDARAKAAPNGKLPAGTADAYLGSDNYAKAIELYRLALQKGGVDADVVNTRLGIALARSGDKAGARAAFEAVKTSPRSDVAKLWILFLDHPPVG